MYDNIVDAATTTVVSATATDADPKGSFSISKNGGTTVVAEWRFKTSGQRERGHQEPKALEQLLAGC